MVSPTDIDHSAALRGLTGSSNIDRDASDTALTVWSIPQFEHFQTVFSHGVAQLQHHYTSISTGESDPGSPTLLMSSIVDTARAMSKFLQRRYAMMQKLQGLGRVVETKSSKTWYAQPDNLWLRRAVADLKAKCDAFTWLVTEMCRACKPLGKSMSTSMAPVAVATQMPLRPTLRSYNSFSSIGSEAPCARGRNHHEARSNSNASTPTTNPFSDSSSVYSTGIFSTGPSSLNSNSPVEANDKECSQPPRSDDGQHDTDMDPNALPDYMLSTTWRDLLELYLGGEG